MSSIAVSHSRPIVSVECPSSITTGCKRYKWKATSTGSKVKFMKKKIFNAPWTAEEEQKVLELRHKRLSYKAIAELMPDRTEVAIANRFSSHIRVSKEAWKNAEIIKLKQLFDEEWDRTGKVDWKTLGRKLKRCPEDVMKTYTTNFGEIQRKKRKKVEVEKADSKVAEQASSDFKQEEVVMQERDSTLIQKGDNLLSQIQEGDDILAQINFQEIDPADFDHEELTKLAEECCV